MIDYEYMFLAPEFSKGALQYPFRVTLLDPSELGPPASPYNIDTTKYIGDYTYGEDEKSSGEAKEHIENLYGSITKYLTGQERVLDHKMELLFLNRCLLDWSIHLKDKSEHSIFIFDVYNGTVDPKLELQIMKYLERLYDYTHYAMGFPDGSSTKFSSPSL